MLAFKSQLDHTFFLISTIPCTSQFTTNRMCCATSASTENTAAAVLTKYFYSSGLSQLFLPIHLVVLEKPGKFFSILPSSQLTTLSAAACTAATHAAVSLFLLSVAAAFPPYIHGRQLGTPQKRRPPSSLTHSQHKD